MHTNHQLRESLIHQADAAYIALMDQIDNLLSLVGFYLERYPSVTHGEQHLTRELVHTVTLLGKLPTDLARVITEIKGGVKRTMTPMEVELVILNEIWANVQAVVYWIKSGEMSLDPFEYEQSAIHFATLMRANRLLT
jgi:hypothetical protein